MTGNQALALEVIEAAWRAGVRTFCLCPGGRNAPLVEALEPLRAGGAEVIDFFEERSAAFFALGRARRDRRPVAVLTTSGTAAAELTPAMVEAYYQAAPLLAITADRPAAFRGMGAPQSIEQAYLFGVYSRQAVDLEQPGSGWAIDSCCWPVHVNACFGEPLLDGWQAGATAITDGVGEQPEQPPGPAAGLRRDRHVEDALATAVASITRPLVILGGLWRDADRDAAASYCRRLAAPVLAEASSHLRHRLAGLSLRGGEGVAASGLRRGWFDGIIRIGDIPSFRLWRDLETLTDLPVVSVSRVPWRGLTHGLHRSIGAALPLPVDALVPSVVFPASTLDEVRAEDACAVAARDRRLRRYPLSEPALMRQLSETIPAGSFVYLGNSLPIREWNQFASLEDRVFEYGENRGANGIDGQLSTFLGWAKPGQENWAIVGDLTALYDLPAPWALPSAAGPVRIVVVNNGGGRIFRRMYRNPRYQLDHAVAFDLWARMWGAAYTTDAREVGRHDAGSPGGPGGQGGAEGPPYEDDRDHVVVEIRPDEAETDAFWRDAAEPPPAAEGSS
ncbi:MAG TPA: 2-succinyl-5-enolpyruvyl-6-hydroxy-3-cyclohexene-1-carboxylic-acid synthase [Vicinamibacterales bacterium]|nr:2-succinyl-5-enolpyruvyl-6-hydroxy-3-cyclohexene-1-carboxylic-acid synthase [Vicinamibacterales bacterium]